eukprot:gene9587-biopygen2181
MATASGVDPSSRQTVLFNHTNETFMRLLESVVEAPLRKIGVDFMWPDWKMGMSGSTS